MPRLSCIPGESFLPVLDALRDSTIELDIARHEAGAGTMALAGAELTGRAGVVAVSRGPGAMHAAVSLQASPRDEAFEALSGTDLVNPNFTALTQAYGVPAVRVTNARVFIGQYESLARRGRPRLIEVMQDSDHSTPDLSLTQISAR